MLGKFKEGSVAGAECWREHGTRMGQSADGLGGYCHHFGFDLGDGGPLQGFEESRDGL